tara:strand:- start:181 stop:480 length:300 start_codon:yes stop_codon:yes gene_type:complete
VFDGPKRTKDSNFTVLYKKNNKNHPRLGLIISKKNCKHASKRNRLKRIVRESFRNNISKLKGHDIVVLNKHTTYNNDAHILAESLMRHWIIISEEKQHG